MSRCAWKLGPLLLGVYWGKNFPVRGKKSLSHRLSNRASLSQVWIIPKRCLGQRPFLQRETLFPSMSYTEAESLMTQESKIVWENRKVFGFH